MPDVLVVNRIAFGFAHLLENNLLRELRRDAAQDSFRNLRNQQSSAGFRARVELARLFHGHLQIRVFDLLGTFNDRLHRIGIDLAGVFVENRAQIFLRLVILSRRDHDRIFNRADHDARIDAFFPADAFDDVIKLACHRNSKTRYQVSGLRKV